MITFRTYTAQEMLEKGIHKYFYVNKYLIAFLLLFTVSFSIGAGVKAHREKINCKSFATWTEAKLAYDHGNRALDGDGDGIPCESLLPIHSTK